MTPREREAAYKRRAAENEAPSGMDVPLPAAKRRKTSAREVFNTPVSLISMKVFQCCNC